MDLVYSLSSLSISSILKNQKEISTHEHSISIPPTTSALISCLSPNCLLLIFHAHGVHWNFSLYVFTVHLCCRVYWNPILFYWQTLSHCMDVSCLCPDLLADGYLNSSNLLPIIRNTVLNTWVQICVWTYISISFNCRYRIVSYVTLCPIIWGTIRLFSKAAVSPYFQF